MAEVGDQTHKAGQKRRAKKMDREVKIRRLTNEQMNVLELHFARDQKLESSMKVLLAAELGLEPNQVAVWFQNRRARWKNKQLEEEYRRLKSMHEIIDRERCQLENEVVELKGKLAEAEEAIKKLSQVPMGNYQMLLGEDWFNYEYEWTYEDLMTSCVDFV